MIKQEILDVIGSNVDDAISKAHKILPNERIVRLCVENDIYWMRQYQPRQQIDKSATDVAGHSSMLRQKQKFERLAARDVMLPRLVTFSDNYLVFVDYGLTLADIVDNPAYSDKNRSDIFFKAGRELANLHVKGLFLKKGKAEDYSWDGKNIIFTNFEEIFDKSDLLTHRMLNIWFFVHHAVYIALKRGVDISDGLKSFMRGYTSSNEENAVRVVKYVTKFARRRQWLVFLTFPIGYLKKIYRSDELKAIAPALSFLSKHSTQ